MFTTALVFGAAISTLPIATKFPLGNFYSAAGFGAGSIIATAVFGMWSMRIFRKTPSIGFGVTFFLISFELGIDPVAGAYLAPAFGLSPVIIGADVLCGLLVALRPADAG